MDLPEGVARVEVLNLAPEDTLVVSLARDMSPAEYEQLKEVIGQKLGHGKMAILSPGTKLSVIRHERHSCAEVVAELGAMMKDLAP